MRNLSLFLLIVVLIGGGCGYYESKAAPVSPSAPAASGKVTFAEIQSQVLDPFCLRCHGDSGGYSFDSYENTMKAVVVGDSAASLLCTAQTEGYMPPRGAKPSAELVKMVCDWIDAGASEI